MKYQFSDHVRCCIYNNQVIFLDLKSDEYIFLSEENSVLLKEFLLAAPNNYKNKTLVNKDNKAQIMELERLNFIKIDNCTNLNCNNIANQKISTGASNLDWNIEEEVFSKKVVFAELFYAYLVIIYVHVYLYYFGFYKIIKKLNLLKLKTKSFKERDPGTVMRKVNALNRAVFFYPKRVKCLEWSIALSIMLIKVRQKASLTIGIQNQPFASHAWTNVEGKIIADDDNLPNNLGVILNEPVY